MSKTGVLGLEVWVQPGIPEDGELVFNIHFRNGEGTEWEVSYRLSQFGNLDIEINKRTDALKDVAFPSLSRKATEALISPNSKYKDKLKDLERCRMTLEQWIFFVISRIDVVPPDLKYGIEMFMFLPNGPDGNAPILNYEESDPNVASLASLAVSSSSGNKDKDDDVSSQASSQYTNGSLDSNGVPKRVKKTKRLMKGAKKRVSNLLRLDSKKGAKSDEKKEQFGVDFSKMTTGDGRNGVGSLINSQTSGSSGHVSDPKKKSPSYKQIVVNNAPQQVQPGKLLKVRVARGAERSKGNPEYEIFIEFNPDKKPYTTTQIFHAFEELRNGIKKADGVGITAEFPETFSKSSFGIGLSEEQQAERTRLLDGWVKNIMSTYQYMNDKERSLVRKFLNLELSVQKDIYIQDKMANGLVEAPRAKISSSQMVNGISTELKSETGSSRVSSRQMSSPDRLYSSARSLLSDEDGEKKPGPRRRASLKAFSRHISQTFSDSDVASKASPPVKSYNVKIVSSSNSGTSTKAEKKLDFRDLAAPVYTDEDTIDADKSLSGTSITNTIEGSRPLSQIREERDSQVRDTEDTNGRDQNHQKSDSMEENLLRIGTAKKKKDFCGTCVVS